MKDENKQKKQRISEDIQKRTTFSYNIRIRYQDSIGQNKAGSESNIYFYIESTLNGRKNYYDLQEVVYNN